MDNITLQQALDDNVHCAYPLTIFSKCCSCTVRMKFLVKARAWWQWVWMAICVVTWILYCLIHVVITVI